VRALVVDDSAVMRRTLIGALSRAGIDEVDQASDGEQAVAAVQNEEYGLILMDWSMPVLNGMEALQKIRSLGKTMPIVMVTTEAEKARIIEALKLGATNYILKPFDPEAIAAKLREVVEKAGSK
jgi:two-component system, chemotaxis family, chemotaxis protein CheY